MTSCYSTAISCIIMSYGLETTCQTVIVGRHRGLSAMTSGFHILYRSHVVEIANIDVGQVSVYQEEEQESIS